MRCPHCQEMEDKVIESRTLADGTAIRRRRECLSCGYRYTSYERVEERPLMVIKTTGAREPFDRDKLERGVVQAVRKRPISQLQIEEIINGVEDRATVLAKSTHEISSHQLGEMLLDALYDLDRVAYVRFASVYRNFTNVQEFVKEIERLKKANVAQE